MTDPPQGIVSRAAVRKAVRMGASKIQLHQFPDGWRAVCRVQYGRAQQEITTAEHQSPLTAVDELLDLLRDIRKGRR